MVELGSEPKQFDSIEFTFSTMTLSKEKTLGSDVKTRVSWFTTVEISVGIL